MTSPAMRYIVRQILVFINQVSFSQIFVYIFIGFQIIHPSKQRHFRFDSPLFVQMHFYMYVLFLHRFQIFLSVSCYRHYSCAFFCRDEITANYLKRFFSRLQRIIVIMWNEFFADEFFAFCSFYYLVFRFCI